MRHDTRYECTLALCLKRNEYCPVERRKKRVRMNDSVFHNDKCNNNNFITSLLSH